MDKDLLKGLLYLLAAVAVVVGLFLVFSDDDGKAACIARALKSGVSYGNIESVCRLTSKS